MSMNLIKNVLIFIASFCCLIASLFALKYFIWSIAQIIEFIIAYKYIILAMLVVSFFITVSVSYGLATYRVRHDRYLLSYKNGLDKELEKYKSNLDKMYNEKVEGLKEREENIEKGWVIFENIAVERDKYEDEIQEKYKEQHQELDKKKAYLENRFQNLKEFLELFSSAQLKLHQLRTKIEKLESTLEIARNCAAREDLAGVKKALSYRPDKPLVRKSRRLQRRQRH